MNAGRTLNCLRATALLLASWVGLAPAMAQDELPLGTHTWTVSMPNGDFTGTVEDMNVKVLGGYVRVTREYAAMRWKVNPNWGGLTTEDFLKQYVPGYFFVIGSCYVSDPRQDCIPSGGSNSVAALPDYDPYPAQINGVWFDRNFGAQEYGRIGVLYRNGVGFKRRQGGVFVLEDQPRYLIREVQVPTIPDSAGPDSHPASGIPGSGGLPVTLADGYRWQDRTGHFIEYDARGRLVSYGDRNDNRVWMQYNSGNRLERVLDHFGVTVLTLHYTGDLLTEIRDYPHPSIANDLPQRRVQYQYDGSGRLHHVIDVRGNQTTYEYTNGRLTSITDPESRVKAVSYGPTGRVESVTEVIGGRSEYTYSYDKSKKQFYVKVKGPDSPAGRRVEDYTYDDQGRMLRMEVNGRPELEMSQNARIERLTDGRGNVTETRRNEYEQVVSETYADGTGVSFSYEARFQQLASYRDEDGISDQLEYDVRGNLSRVVEAVGTPEQRATTIVLDEFGQVVSETREATTIDDLAIAAATISRSFDASGNPVTITDAEGNLTRYEYNRLGRFSKITDPKNGVWLVEYDAAGNVTSTLDPNEHRIQYVWDAIGNLQQVTDARGKVTRHEYDFSQRLTRITDPVGKVRSYQYNGWGLVTRQTDADGRSHTIEYDGEARPSRYLDAGGNAISMAYLAEDGTPTASFEPTRIDYPTYRVLQRFDARNRLVQETTLLGEEGLVTSHRYDRRGRQSETTDANGKTRYFVHDAFGRLTRLTDSLGNSISLAWDTRDNLLSVRYADGARLRFEYDRANRVTREILPLGQTTSYSYDANGNVSETVRTDGSRVVFGYDAADRLIRTQVFPVDATEASYEYTYSYDENDELAGWSDGTHGGTFTYDDSGRMLSETTSYGNGISLGYSYAYTDAGYKRTFTYPDGTALNYTHDPNGELAAVEIPGEGTLSVNEWQWLAPKRVTLPGGTVRELTYDGLLNLTGAKVKNPGQELIFELAKQYGSVEEVEQSTLDGATTAYSYDDERRLTQAVTTGTSSRTETFTSDARGNRLTQNGVSGNWQYDLNNRLSSKGNVGYEYDALGNLTRKTVGSSGTAESITQYVYDGLGRLIQVQNGAGVVLATYAYDPFDNRLWKEVGGVRTHYLYSEEGLIAEANAAGTVTTLYGWKPGGEWSTDPLFLRTTIGSGPSAYVGYAYLHNDQLGTPHRATDIQGRIVWSATYDSFGAAALAAGNQIEQPLRLPGQYLDRETGLHYNTRRYYDPEIGRYVSQDPEALAGGWNFYSYADGNPINQADPTGEWIWVAIRVAITVYDVYTDYKAIRENGLCNEWTRLVPFPVKVPRVKWVTKRKKVCDSICECSIGNSFTSDTPVHVRTAAGEAALVPIKDIKIGDEVLAWSEWKDARQALSYEKVTDVVSSRRDASLIRIHLDTGEVIEATPGHPLRTTEGWRDAALIKRGGKLLVHDAANNRNLRAVTVVEVEAAQRLAELFNLEVANAHTFFVGDDGILAHNAKGGSGKPPIGRRHQCRTKKEAYERAKRAGGGREPKHHPDGEHGPHYHPDVPQKDWTPKRPRPHDHYYYPRRRR